METAKRTPIKENNELGTTRGQTARANRSAVQWLFNPYSVADTTNWAVSTGVGKLAVGGVTKVTNVTDVKTPNRSQKRGDQVVYHSTAEFAGARGGIYVEEERFAVNIANEITNTFPRRIHRLRSLEGIEDTAQVEAIMEVLLGEEMAVAKIDGEADPVPVLPQMRETLRYNMREIAKTNSPQKALILAVGKELERAIEENMKLAVEDLKQPQQEVAQGKRAGFDVNAKRNFLALGRPVPELKLGTPGGAPTPEANQRPVDERILSVLEKFAEAFGEPVKVQGEPETVKEGLTGSLTDPDEATIEGGVTMADVNAMLGTMPPIEAELEFESQPGAVETKRLTDAQVEKAQKAEDAKAAKQAEADAEAAEKEAAGIRQCAAITKAGTQCTKDAAEGSRFCRQHEAK